MSPHQHRLLLSILKGIQARKEPVYPHTGICYNAYLAVGREGDYDPLPAEVFDKALEAQIRKWPKYSGNSTYPVPCPKGGDPQLAWSSHYPNLWQGEYGDLRRELLDFLINELEQANGTGNE